MPLPHVDGVDAGRAALEQHVGEAAGAGPHVGAHPPGDRHAKRIERPGQLEAAAADVGHGRGHLDLGIARYGRAGLIHALAVDAHLAGHDRRPRPRPRLGQAALHQQYVEAFLILSHF